MPQMSESSSAENPTVDEPDWPTHCEHCGDELVSTEVDVIPGGDEQQNIPITQDVCPNPECPSKAGGAGPVG